MLASILKKKVFVLTHFVNHYNPLENVRIQRLHLAYTGLLKTLDAIGLTQACYVWF